MNDANYIRSRSDAGLSNTEKLLKIEKDILVAADEGKYWCNSEICFTEEMDLLKRSGFTVKNNNNHTSTISWEYFKS